MTSPNPIRSLTLALIESPVLELVNVHGVDIGVSSSSRKANGLLDLYPQGKGDVEKLHPGSNTNHFDFRYSNFGIALIASLVAPGRMILPSCSVSMAAGMATS